MTIHLWIVGNISDHDGNKSPLAVPTTIMTPCQHQPNDTDMELEGPNGGGSAAPTEPGTLSEEERVHKLQTAAAIGHSEGNTHQNIHCHK
jgi:hypothetical protein